MEQIILHSPQMKSALLASWSHTSSLQNCQRKKSLLKSPGLWHFVIAALENYIQKVYFIWANLVKGKYYTFLELTILFHMNTCCLTRNHVCHVKTNSSLYVHFTLTIQNIFLFYSDIIKTKSSLYVHFTLTIQNIFLFYSDIKALRPICFLS